MPGGRIPPGTRRGLISLSGSTPGRGWREPVPVVDMLRAAVAYFERSGTPFIIAVNCFDGAPRFEPEDIGIALTLKPEVPIVMFDARNRDSVKKVLVSLVRYVLSIRSQATLA